MKLSGEFSIVRAHFADITAERDDVVIGIGDDAALLTCHDNQYLAISTDTLVAGVHFFTDVDAEALGHKSLAVGLSDLAAMAATPAWFTLALTMPDINQRWLSRFAHGLAALANVHNIQLVGGDTTRGPLTISIQVHGFVDKQYALKRDGAQVGDYIYVTGSLGDAAASLKLKLQQINESVTECDRQYLSQRLEKPTPRVVFSQQIKYLATAAIDISDGLAADLSHILTSSKVGACLDLAALPLSSVLASFNQDTASNLALYGGDDYELCFTIPPHNVYKLASLVEPCHCIGVINSNTGVLSAEIEGQKIALPATGYNHFTNAD